MGEELTYDVSVADRVRLITLFAYPQPTYARRDAAFLSGMSVRQFAQALRAEGIVPEHGRLAWEDVAALVLGRLPPLLPASVLGVVRDPVIPALNQPVPLQVWLPSWQLVLLDHIAAIETSTYPWTRSDVLTLIVNDWVDPLTVQGLYEQRPDVRAAVFYPHQLSR
jgi:hypothetical protein